MGFLSGLGRGLQQAFDPSRVAMSQALLAGDYGAVGQLGSLQARQRAAEAEAQAAREAEARRHEAAAALGVSKEQLNAMRPEEVSQLLQERFQTRQFGPEGGSVRNVDPGGQVTYDTAPWQRQIGRGIIGGGPNGAPAQEIYQGIEPIAVQPGGSVYGWTNQGPAGGAPQQAPPPAGGPQPGAVVNGYRFRGGNPNDPNSWEPVQGGAGSGGAQRPFDASQIPANFTSGRRTPEGNRLVGGVPGSQHLSGNAGDFTPRGGQTMNQLEADLRRRFPNARVLNEGDHVHVEIQGWNVPYHGRRGTTGLGRR